MDSLVWQVPVAPGPARPISTLSEHRKAYVSPYAVRRASDAEDTTRYMSGAVYDDGRLVAASQRAGGYRGDFVRADDPAWAGTPAGVERLRGRWLYGGHWMGQFGHFITETLTTVWPRDRRVEGVVFHRFLSPDVVEVWQRRLLAAAGWRVPVVVRTDGCVVDQLVVPVRPLTLNVSADERAVEVWRRVAAATEPAAHRRIFLSRSRLAEDTRRLPGDEDLDVEMRRLGFHVVHPETLDVSQQVAVVAGADVLAGVSGSALHLSAFARPGAHVLELGDRRTPVAPVPNQVVIDAALGHPCAFVPLALRDGRRDVPTSVAAVAELLGEVLA